MSQLLIHHLPFSMIENNQSIGREIFFLNFFKTIFSVRLQELFIASRALAETIGVEEDLSFNKFNAEPSLISVINLTELAIKRIIKMSKQIYRFSENKLKSLKVVKW